MRRDFQFASIVGGLAETLTRKLRRGEGNDEVKERRGVKKSDDLLCLRGATCALPTIVTSLTAGDDPRESTAG
jgi:hypothetical protein